MEGRPPTRRRWFRFSLRTMFVVTMITAIALGWWKYHENWMEKRRAFISRRIYHGTRVDGESYYPLTGLVHQPEDCVLPFGLRPFADESDTIDFFSFENISRREVQSVRDLFPEADIFWSDEKGVRQGLKRYQRITP